MKQNIINSLKRNWKMKFVSIILAIITWFVINSMTKTTQEYYINLDYESNLPSNNFEISSIDVKSVKVNVWGDRETIQEEITEASFQAQIIYKEDPNDKINEGTFIYKIEVEPKVRLSEDKIKYSYQPQEAQITLVDTLANEIITKNIRISLENISVNPSEGYIIKSLKPSPTEATIRAKRKFFKIYETIPTDFKEINDIISNKAIEVGLNIQDTSNDVKIIDPADNIIKIFIEVDEAKKTKEFTSIPILYKNKHESLSIQNKKNLKLQLFSMTGPSSIIKNIEAEDIKPYIDLIGMRATGDFPKDIKITFSNDINKKLKDLKYYYYPQSIQISLIKSYEENIQELGKMLFSENLSNRSPQNYNSYNDRASVTTNDNENNNLNND